MIGAIFGRFDELTDKYGIYKVETQGDAYIAAQAEWPLTECNYPHLVVLFALEMVNATMEWSQLTNLSVRCRVGVHTGECVGGIVGIEMQRYHLFGKLTRDVEVLESTAPEGRVQVSGACREGILFDVTNGPNQQIRQGASSIEFEERPEPQLTTSKGEHIPYTEVNGRTFLVNPLVNSNLRSFAVQ